MSHLYFPHIVLLPALRALSGSLLSSLLSKSSEANVARPSRERVGLTISPDVSIQTKLVCDADGLAVARPGSVGQCRFECPAALSVEGEVPKDRNVEPSARCDRVVADVTGLFALPADLPFRRSTANVFAGS